MTNLSTLFIDLDGTLYANNNGMWEAIAARMNAYMLDVLQLPEERIPEMRQAFFLKYGTTLRGLQTHYQVDPQDFLAYVHDIPVFEYLAPDQRLMRTLGELDYPKWILTNSDRAHSQRVLAALGVQDQFDGIIDITALDFRNKPEPEAFTAALTLAGGPVPDECVFVDDIPKNLVPAKQLGMSTVLVGQDRNTPEIDVQIPDIYNLPAAIEQIELLSQSHV